MTPDLHGGEGKSADKMKRQRPRLQHRVQTHLSVCARG